MDNLKQLRQNQAERVMPMIGPLLDAYEQLPNDLKTDPDLDSIRKIVAAINKAMETA